MNYIGRYITKNPVLPSPTAASGMWTLDDALQYQKAGIWPPGYQISRSVRTRTSASAYFSRTPTTAGNRTTWTYSCWFKRGILSNNGYALFGCGATNAADTICYFGPASTGDQLDIIVRDTSTIRGRLTTTPVYRDPGAWYHVVVVWDSGNATSTERLRLYFNGSRVTAFATNTQPSQNTQSLWNSTQAAYIARMRNDTTYYFDGYMTEINFIDGQALTPSSFGYIDTVSNVWQPLPYTGAYGTNGFYLNFKDPTSTTTIGYDYSGNSNNWTANNISVTAGVTYDSMVDSPTQSANGDTGVGGEVRGNYCTLNPISNTNVPLYTSSNGNLTYACSASAGNAGRMIIAGTMLLGTGKSYWEAIPTDTNAGFGIGYYKNMAMDVNSAGPGSTSYAVVFNTGAVSSNAGSPTYTGSAFSYVANDVIGFAYDGTANSLAFYKNGSLIGTYTGISAGNWLPFITVSTGGAATNFSINFGQRAFSYTAPTGFKALCSTNISVPTINNGANYMATTLYTGTSATQTIANTVNNFSFQPDLVWVKSRSAATDHKLTDSVRGVTKGLISDTSGAETTDTNGLTAFGSTGFTLGTDTNYNNSGATYVGWNWKAGGTAVSNTSGTITSSVSANTTAGFSVVSYTGNATAGATVGHGLGVAPSMVIAKYRGGVGSWAVYHSALGATNWLLLNSTQAQTTSAQEWNNTAPTSTVFTVGNASSNSNQAGTNIAYCFAAIAGYSAFGSYTGNGSADGAFIYTGFRPSFVLFKRTDTTSNWLIIDSVRGLYNADQNRLFPNLTNAEDTSENFDLLSNGFKLRDAAGSMNASGGAYIYAAFAENPFKYARAR
jgi:hypothetical protein